jgi:hypothetical protein
MQREDMNRLIEEHLRAEPRPRRASTSYTPQNIEAAVAYRPQA